MTRFMDFVTVLFGACWCCSFTDGLGYCSFPRFLWSVPTGGDHRVWTSKCEYVGNTDVWEKQKEIQVNETEMIVRHKIHASCGGGNESDPRRSLPGSGNSWGNSGGNFDPAVPCYRQDLVYYVICLSEHPGGKFRVRQTINGKQSFSCMKFLLRKPNIVQVFQAAPTDVNEHRLCYDESLQRDEWPWIDMQFVPRLPCSISGGFDFTGYQGETRQINCSSQWKSTRFEMECLNGDGITFYYPEPECSPFNDRTSVNKLRCYSEWTEKSFLFIILAERNRMPKYILRLPASIQDSHSDNQLGYLYFSIVAPLSGHGNPPGKILFEELHFKRSDSGSCYDETIECQAYAANGRCYSENVANNYANYCLRSCGLCELSPSIRPECNFGKEFTGQWLLFNEGNIDNNNKDDVDNDFVRFDIGSGSMQTTSSSGTGSFICKSKHWLTSYYKLLSVFSNGCRPRFSCIHFSNKSTVLEMKMSRSSLKDESFRLCDFQDEQFDVKDQLRSNKSKILFPVAGTRFDSCGLNGIYRFSAKFTDNSSCDGILSDVDPVYCSSKGVLTLNVERCSNISAPIEFYCVAFAQLTNETKFLVTKHLGVNRTQCWVCMC